MSDNITKKVTRPCHHNHLKTKAIYIVFSYFSERKYNGSSKAFSSIKDILTADL